MTRVLITGASGFVARHLARLLKQEGYTTCGVSHSSSEIDGYDRIYQASFGESLIPLFDEEKFDALVHCANFMGADELKINVNGTSRWMEEAADHGTIRQIFLSSVSAKENALSDYGKAKVELENRFLAANQVVFRLGLIIGSGGMFERIRQPIKELPVVPLLDNGNPLVYAIGIDSLCHIIRDAITGEDEALRGRIWQVHQVDPYKLREVMESVRRQFGYSCLFIPVPSLPILWLLSIAELVPMIKLPITSTNIKGLRQNSRERFDSDYARFGYPEEALDTLIAKASAEGKG